MAKPQQNNGGRDVARHEPIPNNDVSRVERRIRDVLAELNARGDELKDILPLDLPLLAFLALVNQALRANPKLLDCTFESLVNACVKAAYDGLRIDGKEAAIVDADESYKDGTAWKKRKVARYMPMVFGLIKQILDAGAALTVKAVVVYANEQKTGRFTLLEGTTPGIHHEPFVLGEPKGDMIGAYAIAEVVAGVFKFEWMDAAAILDVKKESKTDKVWDRWPTEMWKKTVIRRLRKSLNGTSKIRDMEMAMLFPHMDKSAPHPQLAQSGFGHNSGARPTRAAMAALTDQAGTEAGVAMNFGRDDREAVTIDNGREERHEEQQQERRQDPPREEQRQPDLDLPANESEWAIWGSHVETAIADAKTPEALDAAWRKEQPIFKHASKAIRDRLNAKVAERNADLALGDGGAGAGGDDQSTPAGDEN